MCRCYVQEMMKQRVVGGGHSPPQIGILRLTSSITFGSQFACVAQQPTRLDRPLYHLAM
jgi:hypothetical protein